MPLPSLLRALPLGATLLVPFLAMAAAPQAATQTAGIRRLATDMGFVEGPVWLPGEHALIFSDIPGAKLMRWSEKDGLTVYRPSKNTNGNVLDREGRLVTCQQGGRRIVRQEADGTLTTLAERCDGKRFSSPNDLAIDSTGAIWFTDPPWGLKRQREGREMAGNWVFRLDPASGEVTVVLKDRCMPNGIAFSPDETLLYISDTGGQTSHPDPAFHDLPATVSAYAVKEGRLVSTEPVWRIETRCDGMCVDELGNIYTTGRRGVAIWSPAGEPVRVIVTPQQPSNVCFGGDDGRTLFITAKNSLYAIDLAVTGAQRPSMGHTTAIPMTAYLTTSTPGLAISEAYFDKLGFTKVSSEPVMYSDGKALIEIDPERFARPGIKLHRESWAELLPALEAFGPLHELKGGRVIGAPSGVWVYLMDGAFTAPEGVAKAKPSVLGNCAGVSLETTRMEGSQEFWELLGFKVTMGTADQGWVVLTLEDGFGVSIMKPFSCPHMFTNPSLTYFNSGKNPEVIAELRKREVPIAEEITAFSKDGSVDNVILREPGGYGFFIFND